MYQATCDYCGRVHSSKKLETLPQTCNSCHAVLSAPEWIDDDETSLDDIKDAVREVLDERDRSNGSKPVHVIKSEPKYTKQEEKLMQLTNALEDKTDKVKTKISGDIRYCKKPIKDAIEKTKILPDNGDDPMTGWTFIKILIAPVVVGLLLFFMAKLHILYAFTGAMIAVFSALIIMNLPLPWLNRKKLAEQANNDYQEAAKEYDALLKDYEISCSQITRYMSENKTYIRKDMIITTKKHMISWQTDIKKEQQYYNADTLNEEINDMFKCLRWKRAICFIVPVLLLIVSFLCINLERTNTPTEQKVVTGTVASKDINTNTFVIKDSQGREKSFCIRDNDTFWKYTVGDEISVEFNTYESGRKEYRLYENGYTTNIELTET